MPKVGERRAGVPNRPKLNPKLLALMREVRIVSDRHLEKYRWLVSGNGYPLGSSHFDEFLAGESLAVLLRHLGKGDPPELAVEFALEETKEMVKKWNARPYGMFVNTVHELHRWDKAGEDLLEYWYRRLCEVA